MLVEYGGSRFTRICDVGNDFVLALDNYMKERELNIRENMRIPWKYR
jgi:hypothetical protein